MTDVKIYMEGGGNTAATKAKLRQGMSDFLREIKDATRQKSMGWKLVCCGGRDEAFKKFSNAYQNDDVDIVVLLVDAEAPVDGDAIAHLTARDNWTFHNVEECNVHLMTQTMETWIVADRETLQSFYGQYFATNQLPNAQDLETVDKRRLAQALDLATQHAAPKGIYKKIDHASKILTLVNPGIVRNSCAGCNRFFETLLELIDDA